MAQNETLFFTGKIKQKGTTISDSDGTSPIEIFDASIEGANIYGIWVTSNSTVDIPTSLWLNLEGTNRKLTSGIIPVDSIGINYFINLISIGIRQDHNGNNFLRISPSSKLFLTADTALNSGETLEVIVDRETFEE